MNSISFKASVQILYIVLCNYCTTCIIYRDKIKFKLIQVYMTLTVIWMLFEDGSFEYSQRKFWIRNNFNHTHIL